MKRTGNTVFTRVQCGIAAFGMFAMFCIPQLLTVAYGQHTNFHYGVAALAERDLRMKEQQRVEKMRNQESAVTASVTVQTDKGKDHHKQLKKIDLKDN